MASLADDAANDAMARRTAAAAALEQPFPVRTRQAAAVVEGVPTEFVLSAFANCLWITVTQLEKIGTIVRLSFSDVQLAGSRSPRVLASPVAVLAWVFFSDSLLATRC
jgi:hypothetical protein